MIDITLSFRTIVNEYKYIFNRIKSHCCVLLLSDSKGEREINLIIASLSLH